MTLRLARTNAEAHLYMELRSCEICGESAFDPDSTVVVAEDDLASRYVGVCPSCGVRREFIFRIPDEIIVPDPEHPQFGDDRPSELLDPGEWLLVADLIARHSPTDLDGMSGEQRREARVDLRTAATAVGEAMKFVPTGTEAVPPEAFWTDRGHQVYATEPGRFRRDRLRVVAEAYRDLAEGFVD